MRNLYFYQIVRKLCLCRYKLNHKLIIYLVVMIKLIVIMEIIILNVHKFKVLEIQYYQKLRRSFKIYFEIDWKNYIFYI
jgi:uncharacterized protein (DUF983 family)